MRQKPSKKSRLGLAVPEWFAVVGGLGVIIIFAVSLFGGAADTELQKTTSTLLNPAKMPQRYKGNNGFGNGGGDGSTNGFQDSTR